MRVGDFSIGKYEVTKAQFVAFLNATVNDLSIDGVNVSYQQQLIFELSKRSRVTFENGNFIIVDGKEDDPVNEVSWYGANAYCRWLSQQTGRTFRLPTEAEWEYAARGGSQGKPTKYSGGDNINDVAWYRDNANSQTHPVGTKQANELGIYDMSGNVLEWCSDWYGDEAYYQTLKDQGVVTNPKGPESGTARVLRGGSWFDEL